MGNSRSITRIEPGQLALMMGAGYAILGLILGPIFFCIASVMPAARPFGGIAPAFQYNGTRYTWHPRPMPVTLSSSLFAC